MFEIEATLVNQSLTAEAQLMVNYSTDGAVITEIYGGAPDSVYDDEFSGGNP
jgi:hypothetical protein